jgi:alpha-beta hydrolase superfamily lysophospholipase
MATVHEEGPLARTIAGPTLYFRVTAPEGKAEAVVALLHGYAEHSARYAHVMDAWAERGITTVAIDLRGHGRSGGRRGYCDHFSEFLDDAAELKKLALARAPGVPAFFFGHSFGGLVATKFVLGDPTPWHGLVLSAPFFRIALPVPAAKLAMGKLASRLWPTLALSSGLHGADVTHDAARIHAYDEDPLVFSTATARWFTESVAAQRSVLDRARSLTMPLYVVMGTADRVASVAAVREFFDGASSADKTWDAREGLFHEVLNEPDWRSIADRIADWLLHHRG